jgi:hypothetical protein
MSRLDDARKRLDAALIRLESGVARLIDINSLDTSEREVISKSLDESEAHAEILERKMDTAAMRLDATIGRLQGLLRGEDR